MKTLEGLRKIREKAKEKMNKIASGKKFKVVVGMGTSGIAMGAREVLKAFIEEINRQNITNVIVTQTGEKGISSMEPIVDIVEEGKPVVTYGKIDSEKVKRIVEEHLKNGKIVDEYVVSVSEQ